MTKWDNLYDERALEEAQSYSRDDNGYITSPGKFEGEMWYVPYYWALGHDCDMEGDVHVYSVTNKERAIFAPLLKGRKKIKLRESNDGFVSEV